MNMFFALDGVLLEQKARLCANYHYLHSEMVLQILQEEYGNPRRRAYWCLGFDLEGERTHNPTSNPGCALYHPSCIMVSPSSVGSVGGQGLVVVAFACVRYNTLRPELSNTILDALFDTNDTMVLDCSHTVPVSFLTMPR